MWLWRRKDAYLRVYDEWINDIVADAGCSLNGLLEHLKHHADEGRSECVDDAWLASMLNLVDIIARLQKLESPSTLKRLERLYLHWKKDPQHTTPPPQVKDFTRVLDREEHARAVAAARILVPPSPTASSRAGRFSGS